jgi:alpha/beta superfamily hydrolase
MPPPCPPEQLVVEAVRFRAGDCLLEGELVYPGEEPAGMAVLAGPHPLLGGTMHNNVVRGLGDGLARCGLATLRFNYRGAGASEGGAVDPVAGLTAFWQTSRTPDEAHYVEDFAAACAFLAGAVGRDLPRALVGYSFGCTLLPAAVPPGDDRTALVLVAPTVGTHDYASYETLTGLKLVIAPEEDFAADPEELARWYARLPERKRLVRSWLDSHFFRGDEDWLTETVSGFLDREWRLGAW